MKKYGKNPLSYLTLSDELLDITGEWQGYFAYKKHLKVAVILGGPNVADDKIQISINELKKYCKKHKLHIVFFQNKRYIIESLWKEGFKGFCFGQDAIVNLKTFNLNGKKKASIRSSVNYAKRNKMVVEEYDYSKKRSSKIEDEIIEISDEWTKLKKSPELTFAFGTVDFDYYKDIRYFICKHEGRIESFISYYPIYAINGYYLDLTRRRMDSKRGAVDFCLIESFEKLKEGGAEKIYFGGSPLSFIDLEDNINNLFGRTFFYIFKPLFEIFYPAKSEYFFKKKYATEWEPFYIFYYPRLNMRIFLAIINAIYEGGIAGLFLHKIKYLFKK